MKKILVVLFTVLMLSPALARPKPIAMIDVMIGVDAVGKVIYKRYFVTEWISKKAIQFIDYET